MIDFARARRTMVDCQIRTFDVTDRAVLAAFETVARERFVPSGRTELAYVDRPIPVVADDDSPRVLLPPMVLARLLQALAIRNGESVLDVAPGLGYSSALLALLGASVTALEDEPRGAGLRASLASVPGVEIRTGALADSRSAAGPFDAILVNGAVEARPESLLARLRDGGRLACLQGGARSAKGMLYVRSGDAIGFRPLFEAAFPVLEGFELEAGFVF